MGKLLRLSRYAWPYRWRFFLSVLCGLLVAIMWAANLSTVYPVVSVLYYEQNLQQWIATRITTGEERLANLRKEQSLLEPRQESEPRVRKRLQDVYRDIQHLEGRLHRDRILQRVIDRWIPHDRFQTLVALLVMLVVMMMLRGVLFFFQETLVGSVSNRALFDLRNQLFRRALRQDQTVFDEQGTSEVLSRFTNDTQVLSTGLELIMGRLVREPFRILSCLGLACLISWRLTLLTLVVVPVGVLIMSQLARRLRRQSRLSLESISAFYKILQETFQAIKIVKAFNMEGQQRYRFFREGRVYYKKAMRTIELDALVSPITELLGMLIVSGTLLVGTHLLVTGKTHLWGVRLVSEPLDAAALFQLYAALAGLSDPCRKLSNLYGRLQRTAAAAERVFQALDQAPTVVDRPGAIRIDGCREGLVFDNVSFTYPGKDRPVLQGLSLELRAGEKVALVGPNGCGKSTIVNLLARFYDPMEGAIRLDGVDLREIRLRSLRDQLGLVTQDTRLFDETIYQNIARGNPLASPEQVVEAARSAFAHDFIMNLPQQYETRIGEQGGRLSGGQKQRIALARAMLRDPALLILDEATSGVDLESEMLIQKALERFCKGRITLIVTHRLSVLSMVDRVILLDDGSVAAQGTDAELAQHSPLYRRLRELYFQDGLPGSVGVNRSRASA